MRKDKEKYRHTISVAKLLEYNPFIPKYEELDTKQRQVSKCIIKPFESNLNFACSLLGKVWHYVDKEPTNSLLSGGLCKKIKSIRGYVKIDKSIIYIYFILKEEKLL